MKTKFNLLILFISIGLSVSAQTTTKTLPKLAKDPVSKVIAAMSLEEKVTLVVGAGMRMPGAPPEAAKALEQMSPAVGQSQDLESREVQTLTFIIDSRSLSSFNLKVSGWVADAGEYTVKFGASSKDIRQKASFSLGKYITVKKESAALLPKEKINELKPQ